MLEGDKALLEKQSGPARVGKKQDKTEQQLLSYTKFSERNVAVPDGQNCSRSSN